MKLFQYKSESVYQDELDGLLNNYSAEGWMLVTVCATSVGWFRVIFEREIIPKRTRKKKLDVTENSN